tara:strand:+ start:331 stop:915 length:585 start_codon:yes stop_codon:yes gene_type:complete
MIKTNKYKILKRKKVCSNSLFDIYFDDLDIDNQVVENYLMVKPKVSKGKDKIVGICVLPEFQGKFLLMQGWRYQIDEFIWQAPAGFVEQNEEPSDTALRELKEETSLICKKKNLISLGSFLPDAGLVEGRVALFLAMKCKKLDQRVSFEVGIGDLHHFSKKDLEKLINSSSNIGGSTITTSLRSLNYIGFLNKK